MNPIAKKVALRTIPLLILMFIFNFMDRVNVGFAALQMNQELGFSPMVYGFGAGLFFVSYFLFEIPSNVLLHRFGARIWIARIVITWGLVACATAFIQGRTSFYVMRFLLGVAEAGFYPGIVFYLSGWFREEDRARTLAFFQTGQALAVVIGGPLSTWLMQFGWFGLPGWRWMFLLEGVPSVVLGILCLFLLRDKPADVQWLTTSERTWLVEQLEQERKAKVIDTTALRVLTDRRVIPYAAAYFCLVIAVIGVTLWLPQIIRSMGSMDTTTIGLLSAIPWILGLAVQYILSMHSDHTGERKYHIGLMMMFTAVAFIISSTVGNVIVSFVCITFALAGMFSISSLFWTMPTTLLKGVAAASAIAFINSTAMVGGFVGPFLIGWIRDATQSYAIALVALGVVLLAGATIVLTRRAGRDYVVSPRLGAESHA